MGIAISDFLEFPTDGEHKDAYLSYETFFVRNQDVQKFDEWIVKQNFSGRFMPHLDRIYLFACLNIRGCYLMSIRNMKIGKVY